MALPASSLSLTCRSIADFLSTRLDAAQNNIKVRIGNPASAVQAEGETDHRVNLFFYRVESDAFGPAAAPDENWLLRLCCLITSFGADEDQISAGENDLRLLGAVLTAFHERPVLDPIAINGTTVRAQVVFQPLGLEEVNNLWATQGDIAYRPSVAYEMALVPIIPRHPRVDGPLVGAIGFEVRADEDGRHAPFAGHTSAPVVVAHVVDTRDESWAPRISFVGAAGCTEFAAFTLGSQELTDFAPRVWIAGENASPVRLRWEIWDAQLGWRAGGTDVNATATGERLDPDAAATAPTTAVTMPFKDHKGQAALYAERTFQRGADGAQLTVRSNPLLVNIF